MNILTSSYSLDLSGVPTFTLTMYEKLTKKGHNVVVYSPVGGKLENQINTVENVDELKKPDIILAQSNICAEDLKKRFPEIPLVFYSHGLLPDMEQPPKFKCDWYFAINTEVQNNLISKGVDKSKITIIRDFIDTNRFISKKPINKKLSNVLFISNYKKWKNFKTIRDACNILGVNLSCFGSPYGRSYKIEDEINKADLVISWGRGILEAMSTSRAVLSFDKQEGDGYITTETYFKARENNFSGRVYKYNFDANSLAQEMSKYNANDGITNRNLIEKYHSASLEVDEILKQFFRIEKVT